MHKAKILVSYLESGCFITDLKKRRVVMVMGLGIGSLNLSQPYTTFSLGNEARQHVEGAKVEKATWDA